MNDEKQMILNMLKEGKITVEQASDLLGALGANKNKSDNLTNKITGAVDSIIKKATDTIQAIDFDQALDLSQFNFKGEYNTHKEIRVDDEIKTIDIDIVNGDIEIDKSDDNSIAIRADVWAKKADLSDFLNVEVAGDKLSINLNEAYKLMQATCDLKISLPASSYDDLSINQVNGKIEIADVDFNNLDLNTVNGRILLINTKAFVNVSNVNGKIDIKNVFGPIDINNVNGSIYAYNIGGDYADISTVNGNLRVDGLGSSKLTANSNSGTIRVFNIKNTKEISLKSGFGNMVVDTSDFDGIIRANVESKSINITEKFANKIQDGKGYEISTSTEDPDLSIKVSCDFGRVSLR